MEGEGGLLGLRFRFGYWLYIDGKVTPSRTSDENSKTEYWNDSLVWSLQQNNYMKIKITTTNLPTIKRNNNETTKKKKKKKKEKEKKRKEKETKEEEQKKWKKRNERTN